MIPFNGSTIFRIGATSDAQHIFFTLNYDCDVIPDLFIASLDENNFVGVSELPQPLTHHLSKEQPDELTLLERKQLALRNNYHYHVHWQFLYPRRNEYDGRRLS